MWHVGHKGKKGTTVTDQFDGPGSASGIDWNEYNGRLLLIAPLSREEVNTQNYGVKEAIRADVIVLDGDDAPEGYPDVLIFPKVLQGQLRSNVGKGRMNLGRLMQGEARKGQKPPWILADPTDADREKARAYLASQEEPPF
ncbi:hypothetical protein GCM10012275_28700 [Longimycelium tulufanense]|uniref:Uncharacterized protein n=1 Tax=Longimycelium tulufanense TaxID=907463 RepID=A0A8J3C8N7_9PSEU|nr:hypothetical protein [Longimycelium tulufanense]GGM55841.1 hypothetical protein GCM10012275_28700 [Longimycelium tulufanense]